jgi:hypothetical protein
LIIVPIEEFLKLLEDFVQPFLLLDVTGVVGFRCDVPLNYH